MQACRESAELEAYRVYVTDSLMLQGRGQYLDRRYHDVIRGEYMEDFDAQDVIDGVISRAGLEVIP